jgi:hypothetical protein
MGLDAVVYVNKLNLDIDQSSESFLLDEQTGEIYPSPGDGLIRPAQEFTAIHRRLGNATMIGALANEISRVVDPNSILLKSILYSASHSGDSIGVENLRNLESEMNLVRQRTEGARSHELDGFLTALAELIEAAKRENNPIVFT